MVVLVVCAEVEKVVAAQIEEDGFLLSVLCISLK
jgi:hypothetical protein